MPFRTGWAQTAFADLRGMKGDRGASISKLKSRLSHVKRDLEIKIPPGTLIPRVKQVETEIEERVFLLFLHKRNRRERLHNVFGLLKSSESMPHEQSSVSRKKKKGVRVDRNKSV